MAILVSDLLFWATLYVPLRSIKTNVLVEGRLLAGYLESCIPP